MSARSLAKRIFAWTYVVREEDERVTCFSSHEIAQRKNFRVA